MSEDNVVHFDLLDRLVMEWDVELKNDQWAVAENQSQRYWGEKPQYFATQLMNAEKIEVLRKNISQEMKK